MLKPTRLLMNCRYFYFFLLFLPSVLLAQGVQWELTLENAFKKAKSLNKPLFVEFYSPTCPYCKQVDPFFNDAQAGRLYNEGFVNYKLNVDSDEGREFSTAVDLDVYGIPYFLFFKADSTLIHAREVAANLNSVLQPGKMVVEDTYSAHHYPKRFANGERSENFLAQYALFSRVAKDMESNRKAIDALWAVYPDSKKNSSGSWAITKKATMDVDNGFVDYWLSNLSQAKAHEDASKYGDLTQAFSRILYGTIFSKRAETFTADKWKELQTKFGPAIGEKEVFGLLWEKEARANAAEGNQTAALEIGKKAFGNYKTEAGSLVYLSQVFNDICKDKSCFTEVETWLETARHLQMEDSGKAMYFLQVARLDKNQGKVKEATAAGKQALALARAAKIDTTIYDNFLKEL